MTQTLCSRCIMDTTVPDIRFDDQGWCQYCRMHDVMDQRYPLDPEVRTSNLERLVERIKRAGSGKRYDCVCGVSGGRDSTWTLLTVCRLGLRPLAVHFDNGWNSATAVANIRNSTERLHVDLETVVADWEEFRDIQVAFLEASVPDVEVPTDVAIHTVLHKIAAREGIAYVLNGHSFRTEGIAPIGWTYMDGRYIDGIHKRFGTRTLKHFHNFRIWDLIYFGFLKRIKVVPLLNYSDYNHDKVMALLSREVGWVYYGGHHHESTYTEFIQSYLLPQKFNIDKRKTELSALIRSGQTDRSAALETIRTEPYAYDDTLLPYVLSKLEITPERWQAIWERPPRSFKSYPSYYPLMKMLRQPIRLLSERGFLPELLYLKYLG